MNLLLLIVLHPRRAVESIKSAPQWVILFIVLAAVSIILMLLQHAHVVRLTLDHLPASATVEDKFMVEQSLHEQLAIRCAFLPIRLLVGWASFALLLLYACKAWSMTEPVRFQQVFSLEVAAESVMVLAQCASFIYSLAARDASFVRIPFGLDMMISQSHDIVLRMALNAINVFSLWYVVILAMGISTFYGISKIKSITTVTGVWVVTQLFSATVISLLRDALHLQL